MKIAGREFKSRLILGTGKYPDFETMRRALEASGTEIVTVAVRRVNLSGARSFGRLRRPQDDKEKRLPQDDKEKRLPQDDKEKRLLQDDKVGGESLLDYLDRDRYLILPNTAGCYTAAEAIRIARLGREAGLSNWVKLEVIGDEKTLLPDVAQLLEATQVLVKEGFVVMPYTNDDPITAKRLEEAGAACVMPLAAPIGSGQGILNTLNIRFILEQAKVPVIVDAGVGTASDAAVAMELGVDGVLMNTAVACAQEPVKMALAMREAVIAGRLAFEAGRITKKPYASASSPAQGVVGAAVDKLE